MSPKIQIQTLSILLVIILVIAGLGLYQESSLIARNFIFIHSVIFIAALVFLAISYEGRKKYWIWVFSAILIISNPFYRILGFNEIILRTFYFFTAFVSALFVWGYYNTYRKGTLFEKYVADRFPDGIWTIVDRAKDYSKKLGRMVESDQNPDFTFRHNTTGNKIAVECKYRSYFYQGGIEIKREQIRRYKDYSQKENIPVYVFIGVGNSPQNPEQLFAIPLEKADNLLELNLEIIAKENLKPFEIDAKKEFIKPM